MYPARFLFIWFFDFISAMFGVVAIMYEDLFTTDKERLKLSRQMDIENLTNP